MCANLSSGLAHCPSLVQLTTADHMSDATDVVTFWEGWVIDAMRALVKLLAHLKDLRTFVCIGKRQDVVEALLQAAGFALVCTTTVTMAGARGDAGCRQVVCTGRLDIGTWSQCTTTRTWFQDSPTTFLACVVTVVSF
jgi:hypothetical protein